MMLAAMLKPQMSARHGGALKLHRRGAFGEVSKTPLQPKKPANPPLPETGTPHAINYLTLGVAAILPSSPGRGGARNRADRESHALTAVHVANLTAATAHAEAIGLPFTRMVTIHWESGGVPLAGMAKATRRYLDLLTKFLARRGHCSAWLFSHENCGPKGGHCHLLAHVPADLVSALTRLQRGWLRIITGKPYRARVIRSRPIGKRLGNEVRNPSDHAINLAAALSYVLKGASAAAAEQFNLERLEPGGRVIGKRCGTSENIGATARKAKD